ncbi:MAG: hypothetical protein ACLTMP_08115 [Eggerthella lenta]
MVLNSLWNRINHGQDVKQQDRLDITLTHHRRFLTCSLFEASSPRPPATPTRWTPTPFPSSSTNPALAGSREISPPVANELRQRVYVLQMSLGSSVSGGKCTQRVQYRARMHSVSAAISRISEILR